MNWENAEQQLKEKEETIQELASDPRVNIMFYAGIVASLRGRFDKGERSQSLYEDIMELD